jgi:Carboxypeptidase regulatory-like domain
VFARLAALVLFAAIPLGAQSVQGVVVDDSTGQPLMGATATILDDAGKPVGIEARSDTTGRFLVHAHKAGTYRLRVMRIGYQPVTSGNLKLDLGGIVTLRMAMSPAAQAVSTVTVVERRHYTLPELMSPMGFDVRRSRAFGSFMDTTLFNTYGALPISDVLDDRHTSLSLLIQFDARVGSDVIQIVNVGTPCYPEVYLDGWLISGQPTGLASTSRNSGLAGFDEVGAAHAVSVLKGLPADQIYGVEVYRRNQMPPSSLAGDFGHTTAIRANRQACGVVAVWTLAFKEHAGKGGS